MRADQCASPKTFVSASGYASNRSPSNFPVDPARFDPTRWLEPDGTLSKQSFAFYPFSLGPRNCIGRNLAYLEMRLILSRLLWHFDLESAGKALNRETAGDEQQQDWKWEDQKSWILWEKRSLHVGISERKL